MIEVSSVRGTGLSELLRLLEEHLRDGEPMTGDFAQLFREAVEAGGLEVLVARMENSVVGVAVLAYRLSASAAGLFASIEDLYVRPDARRRGVGRALLEAVGKRCASRGVSYVEVQVEDEEAAALYAALGYEQEPGVRVFSCSYSLSACQLVSISASQLSAVRLLPGHRFARRLYGRSFGGRRGATNRATLLTSCLQGSVLPS